MTKEEILHAQASDFLDGRLTYLQVAALNAMDTYARQEAVLFSIWTMRNAYYLTQKSRWYMCPTNPAYNIEGHTDEQILDIYQQQSNG